MARTIYNPAGALDRRMGGKPYADPMVFQVPDEDTTMPGYEPPTEDFAASRDKYLAELQAKAKNPPMLEQGPMSAVGRALSGFARGFSGAQSPGGNDKDNILMSGIGAGLSSIGQGFDKAAADRRLAGQPYRDQIAEFNKSEAHEAATSPYRQQEHANAMSMEKAKMDYSDKLARARQMDLLHASAAVHASKIGVTPEEWEKVQDTVTKRGAGLDAMRKGYHIGSPEYDNYLVEQTYAEFERMGASGVGKAGNIHRPRHGKAAPAERKPLDNIFH